MNPAFQDIAAALTDYFDGIYEGDSAKLRDVFLPNGHLYSVTDGAVEDLDLEAYCARVDGRAAPAVSGAKRYDRILSIDLSGPATALAKVECAIPPKFFTDYLTLLKVEGRWRIVSKTYHTVIHE